MMQNIEEQFDLYACAGIIVPVGTKSRQPDADIR